MALTSTTTTAGQSCTQQQSSGSPAAVRADSGGENLLPPGGGASSPQAVPTRSLGWIAAADDTADGDAVWHGVAVGDSARQHGWQIA
jgi:hypothetical protein